RRTLQRSRSFTERRSAKRAAPRTLRTRFNEAAPSRSGDRIGLSTNVAQISLLQRSRSFTERRSAGGIPAPDAGANSLQRSRSFTERRSGAGSSAGWRSRNCFNEAAPSRSGDQRRGAIDDALPVASTKPLLHGAEIATQRSKGAGQLMLQRSRSFTER